MAVSRALRRLLRIREIEEEQGRMAMKSALADLHRLERALTASLERERRGRRLVQASARSGELPDRLAGLEELRGADRLAQVLAPRIVDSEQSVAGLREEFLSMRVARRQVETLIEEAEARDAVDAGRRSQQALDDWYRNRLHRTLSQAKTAERSGHEGALRSGAAAEGSAAPEET